MVAAHKVRRIEGLAGGCARSMMAEKSYCAAVLLLYLPFTMPYITHGFLRADSRNSMGFILLYGKKNVSRFLVIVKVFAGFCLRTRKKMV